MSSPKPLEMEYLAAVEKPLLEAMGYERGASGYELRLQILEAVASRFGGFDLGKFQEVFGVKNQCPTGELLGLAAGVVSAIERTPIAPALALSALARESLHEGDRKRTGAYHTDFRLASRLAQLAAPKLTHESKVIDPAGGAGMLLAALTYAVCGMDRAKAAYWLANCVYAADLSENSLRGAILSLAVFTDDLSVLKAMRSNWYCGDSLMAPPEVWESMAPGGFDAVIGNPPWEKVKISRHEFLKSSGQKRHYGANIESMDEDKFSVQREKVATYSLRLLERYPILGSGDPDLYIAFTDLFFSLCKDQGIVSALVPGGLIRSQGTQGIRRKVFDACQSISISILDNRARFFAIDTRFKFLAVALVKSGTDKRKRDPIQLLHERGTPNGVEVTGTATIGRAALSATREDLSIPEVRSGAEWRLFTKITEAGISWTSPGNGWAPKFCREVDMTKERSKFTDRPLHGALPLVEGRMVQAHRFGVKGHVAGSGRSAEWEAYAIGASRLRPQFWISPADIPSANQHRVGLVRVGFCDIAGQTNERSLMAALIPPGVVCGNKVPTIVFPEDPSEDRLYVWLAIANSFVFDWMLRRVLTTTVNYFLLQSVPMPKLAKGGLPWKRLENASRELQTLDFSGASDEVWKRVAELRAEIDAEIAVAYGLSLQDMNLILKDFPILDRGQPPLPAEAKSTITRDTVLATVAKRTAEDAKLWSQRVVDAQNLGAIAYVPSELVRMNEDQKKGERRGG
ncbi:hypothetical protein SAMN05877962_102119 [Alloalcanivorax xenomutans]|uniref:Eco57I restriction-modification methylase domain-containing protein n=1 Tax=Alloalcanivorax xenomutans TaxID=1094342 RepID=UPI000BCEACD9|nr:restriction endonuclease [Alloalcanivorax xenomutans]SOB95662.1 hypothetical protein SAMN05877962_102119 [Alloalcanivorax xenomutans]